MSKFRNGRHRTINIYRMVGDEPSDDDIQIGVIWDDEQVAVDAVAMLNAASIASECTCYTVTEFDCPIHGS